MIGLNWRDLVILSVRDPAAAARILLETAPPREALWIGLALVSVLNTLLLKLSNMMSPGPSPLPAGLDSPTLFFFLVATGLLLTTYSIQWVGRIMGGSGSVGDVMLLVIWFQVLRVLVQVVALVLMLISPLLSVLLILAAGLYGIWVLLNFVNQAHRFGSIGRSAVVLIASMLAIVVGLSVLLSLLGGPFLGGAAYV